MNDYQDTGKGQDGLEEPISSLSESIHTMVTRVAERSSIITLFCRGDAYGTRLYIQPTPNVTCTYIGTQLKIPSNFESV
jgi:hypothetical protein